jgi:ribosomal protein S18 acetylase RimI-like enzyme
MYIEEIVTAKGAVCAEILATLPHWFGIAASNQAYIRDVETMPMWAANDSGRLLGFLALGRPTPHVFEVHVMGVKPEQHRHGVGRALIDAAVAHAKAHGIRFLTVKTLSARDSDAGYAKTRAFYTAMGFVPIDELPKLWNPENPAVLMLKVLA